MDIVQNFRSFLWLPFRLLALSLNVVKLHSDLRTLTQLQLVGVGVDFVFPLEGRRKEEGRKEEPSPSF